jgi:hypothetical protein
MDWNFLSSRAKIPRDNNRVKMLVLILKKRGNEKLLLELFYQMSDITIKQVKNLFFLIRFEEFEFISHDECISEAWIVFDRCLKGFNPYDSNDFTIFYNVSLLRHFVRLKNKAYRRDSNNEKIIFNSYDNDTFLKLFDGTKKEDHLNFINEDLYNIGLNIDEIRLFMSKFILNEKKKDFMEQNEDFNDNKYQNTLTSLKDKIKAYAFE